MNYKECATIDHVWAPEQLAGVPPEKWAWRCKACGIALLKREAGAISHISNRELNLMVDSSLRRADKVIVDDQSLRGELWLMRNAIWAYQPYVFQIVYHEVGTQCLILVFRYQEDGNETWQPILDTAAYRKLLTTADVWRRSVP